jgi:glucose/arabinose dehydrogenase
VSSEAVATFVAPWSLAFLPDGRMLVTERPPTPTSLPNPIEPGRLWLVTQEGGATAVTGAPSNVGLLDVKLDPRYSTNRLVYISYMERDPAAPRMGRNAADTAVDPAGLAVFRAKLTINATGAASLDNPTVIWRQRPKVVSFPGSGEPGGRMVFSPDGTYLFIAAGDRQEFEPVQTLDNTLGKIVRIFPDGRVPTDNPFAGRTDALPEIWTLGHRNAYGLTFNTAGELWENEMGPKGGDELNRIQRGANYGWPNVSDGDNYDGSPITKPAANDGYATPALFWTPVIAPSNLIFYYGNVFADWRNDAINSGLQSKGLVRARFTGTSAAEAQRIDMGARIRFVITGPEGALWVLEDRPTGRLLKLSPVF